jgi:hypothetical protein
MKSKKPSYDNDGVRGNKKKETKVLENKSNLMCFWSVGSIRQA